jgi:hypothetical protein
MDARRGGATTGRTFTMNKQIVASMFGIALALSSAAMAGDNPIV